MSKLKVGLLGTSQLSFPGDKEKVFNFSAKGLNKLAVELDYELFVYSDTIISEDDATKAIKTMEAEKVDFLLIQNTSFSAGLLAPILAKIKNANVGIWAIPEGASEGVVPLNSFCCMNMYMSIIAHYLKDNKIKVKWFYGDVDSQEFTRRLSVTIRALRAIKALKNSRVALIGGVAPGFNDLYFDERDINNKLDGIYINRLHEFSEIEKMVYAISDQDAAKTAEEMITCSTGVHKGSKDLVLLSAKVYLAYKQFIKEHKYDALAISCWPKFQEIFKYSVCSVVARLNDEGIIAACEGDLVSAISMLGLKHIANDETMLMDLSDFDESDDTVLMWHCGPASNRFCSPEGYSLGVNFHGLAHEKGKELSCCGVVRDMVFDKNQVTIMRLTGECDKYMLLEGEFIGNTKKSFFGSRGWMGNLKLNGTPISAKNLINTVLVSGYQHHFPIVIGNYAEEVKELAAWLSLKPINAVPYADCLQIID